MLHYLIYLVLSEIHSSLTSSFSLGNTLITSPPLVLTTMLLPTASNTSIVEVFLQQRKLEIMTSTEGYQTAMQLIPCGNSAE